MKQSKGQGIALPARVMQPLGLYISVPFCRAKCTFCNFASDAFAPARLSRYIDRLCEELASSHSSIPGQAHLPDHVDTLYLGGGTPSLLEPAHIHKLFDAIGQHFTINPTAEITLECAPGQLSEATLEAFQQHGLNRVSLGVQSFIDRESTAIGRLHTAALCLEEIARLRAAGNENISIDLICGLPHQTEASWLHSLDTAIAAAIPHISIYMLEIDEHSRLGRELLAQGPRYSATTVPSEDECATWYQLACDRLNAAGIAQYEISNFARPGHQSAHNIKYWRRHPYLGLGLDAHSMLFTDTGAVRFSNTDDLDLYSADRDPSLLPLLNAPIPAPEIDIITAEQAFEESLFLGLRLNEGVSLAILREQFGHSLLTQIQPAVAELREANLLTQTNDTIALNDRGRAISNEVFSRLLVAEPAL
jgi:oxygen-independent coproporphyrinogen-3 oxidase